MAILNNQRVYYTHMYMSASKAKTMRGQRQVDMCQIYQQKCLSTCQYLCHQIYQCVSITNYVGNMGLWGKI